MIGAKLQNGKTNEGDSPTVGLTTDRDCLMG